MDENVPLQVLDYDDQRMLPSLMSSLQERCDLNDQLYERATGTERCFRKVKIDFFSNFKKSPETNALRATECRGPG